MRKAIQRLKQAGGVAAEMRVDFLIAALKTYA
jgi:hypothetical protein